MASDLSGSLHNLKLFVICQFPLLFVENKFFFYYYYEHTGYGPEIGIHSASQPYVLVNNK